MTAILSADWHQSSKPADEYRWGIFDWLLEQDADELIVLGDISDQKDRHDAIFVNRLYSATMRLERKFRVIYLMGNHDVLSPGHPFFEFLGDSSDITFVSRLTEMKLSIGTVLLVPALTDWVFKIPKVDYLFSHATFSGAKAETGRTLTGVDPSVVSNFSGKVYSGDIHTPQTLARGKIEYVGAPYHVRFGDEFEPRLVKIDRSGKPTDLYFPAPKKRTLYITQPSDLRDARADEGDHVKVRCVLRRAEYDKWRDYREQIRKIAADRKWLLFGSESVPAELSAAAPVASGGGRVLDAVEVMLAYAAQHKASDEYIAAARTILG